MAEYGIPYMGSKGKICNELIRIFPKADNFYDLFGGGFSVTHAMMIRRSRDYKSFHFNEIRPGVCDLIRKAIAGEFNYERFKPTFISREEFFEKLETDPYVKICWSFGNNGQGYLFSEGIEPYKRSMHNAIVFNEFDLLAEQTLGMKAFRPEYSINQRRLFLRNRIEFFRLNGLPKFLDCFITEAQRKQAKFKQLQQLQQLQQLERLQQLEQLEFTSASYEQVPIKPNSIVYCDPPYHGTAEYDDTFNTKALLDWADSQTSPVFISEYDIPDKRFQPVFKIRKTSLLCSRSRTSKIEKVYGNRAAILKIRRVA